MRACLSALVMLTSTLSAFAGQVPDAAEQPDIAVSGHDRFYNGQRLAPPAAPTLRTGPGTTHGLGWASCRLDSYRKNVDGKAAGDYI